MLSTLTRLFATPRTSDAARLLGVSPDDIDNAFCGLLLGVQSPVESHLNYFEKASLRDLEQLLMGNNLASSGLVPRLPDALPYVMGMVRHSSPSRLDLVAQLRQDPVLESKIIQLANTPYYRPEGGISTLEDAMSTFGRVGVRQLVVNVAFKPLIYLYSGHFTELGGGILWAQSEKAAIACDCMARQEKMDRFQAYLTALIANIGFTIALKVLDRHFDGKLVPRAKTFHQRFIKLGRALSAAVAREWGLSAIIVAALEAQLDDLRGDTLASMLFAANKLSRMHSLAVRGRFKGEIDRIAEQVQDCFTDACRICYETISD